jgi:CHASE3 domain sensor protein
MKAPAILLSTSFALALLMAGVADAASAKRASSSQTAQNTQASSTNYNQAMYQCASQYAGNRGYLGRDRGGYIETCFKALTGKFPADVGQNCPLRRC